MPDNINIPNYEMSVVLGNLLENAIEACQKLEKKRKIELAVKPQGEQLAIMIRNTFDGNVITNEGQLLSTKVNGGIGLQSVKAVVQRYGEIFLTEHDNEWFSVFILWAKENIK